MATTQDYINQLKIDKQNLVSMLNGMGVEASENETFTSLTPKVGKIVTDPILQDKTVEITENGRVTIKPDDGYDGLNSINLIINIAKEEEYIQDGLVAWFDGEDTPKSNNYWINKLGTDYIYDLNGKALSHNTDCYMNDKTYILKTSSDYLKKGYTIEVVGKINSQNNSDGTTGGWLLTMNETGSWGIGVTGDDGHITFVNNANHTSEKTFTNYYKKRFGASLYLENINNRGVLSVDNGQGSVNGSEWFKVQETQGAAAINLGNHSILCYYARTDGTSFRADGEICCIRIYNRKLTNDEITYNHEIDKKRFNLEK